MIRMNKKQQTIINKLALSVFLIGIFFIARGTSAELSIGGVLREQRKELIQEKIQNIKEINIKEVRENTKSLLEQAKNIIKGKIKKHLKGQVVTISGNTLTVQKDNTSNTVLVTDKTILKRKFGAPSTLSEFSPNDMLIIIGNRVKKSDSTLSSTEIEASYIRNMSIQRRFAVFTGEVTAKSSNTVTLKTTGRGTQTVYVTSSTQYKERNKAITFTDIQIGDRIVVKGELWNRVSAKIDAKTILKLNFQKPSPSVTPSPSAEND